MLKSNFDTLPHTKTLILFCCHIINFRERSRSLPAACREARRNFTGYGVEMKIARCARGKKRGETITYSTSQRVAVIKVSTFVSYFPTLEYSTKEKTDTIFPYGTWWSVEHRGDFQNLKLFGKFHPTSRLRETFSRRNVIFCRTLSIIRLFYGTIICFPKFPICYANA